VRRSVREGEYEDRNLLDGACSDAGPKPHPNLCSKIFTSKGHAVDAEWRLRRRRVKEPCQ
jgi:hypothetical protein